MSRMGERLARAEERLAAIEAREKMIVVIDRYNGREPIVIDYAKPSIVPRSSRRRSTKSSGSTARRRKESAR